MKSVIVILFTTVLLASSCESRQGSDEIAISRSLERAIELGEKILAEKQLIENVAMTQGTDAAVALHDSLRYRKHIEDFWEEIRENEILCEKVTDSLHRKEIIEHLMPMAERLNEIVNEINGAL